MEISADSRTVPLPIPPPTCRRQHCWQSTIVRRPRAAASPMETVAHCNRLGLRLQAKDRIRGAAIAVSNRREGRFTRVYQRRVRRAQKNRALHFHRARNILVS